MLVKLDVLFPSVVLFFIYCMLIIYSCFEILLWNSFTIFILFFIKKNTRATDYKRLHGRHEENIKKAQFKKSTVSHFSERAV